MMIVRNDMPQRRHHAIALYSFSNEYGLIELVYKEIRINNEQWIIITIYQQRMANSHHFDIYIDKLMNEYINNINVIIVGYTNVNMLKLNSLKDYATINSCKRTDFLQTNQSVSKGVSHMPLKVLISII